MTAADVVTEILTIETIDDGILEATAMMYEETVRRLQVANSDGSDGVLTRIVALKDLLVLLTDELVSLAEVVEAESPSYRKSVSRRTTPLYLSRRFY